MDRYDKALQPGTVLRGKDNSYRIDRVLGQGTFGITYLAYTRVVVKGELGSVPTEIQVAVKEFFMRDINGREGSTVTTGGSRELFDKYNYKFRREARNLAGLSHEGIVKVIETFEVNGTSYYAMEYCSGGSLDALIVRRGGLPQGEALELFGQMASALAYMHSCNMLHLDLKPGNVMLRGNGCPVLIDFGLAKQYNEDGDPESSTTIGGGTPGYAPLEQSNYNEEEKDEGGKERQIPVTMDVYALGATLYKMLTGERPPAASDVLRRFPANALADRGVSSVVIAAIRRAMSPIPDDRYQSVPDFAAALQVKSAQQPHSQHDEKTEPQIIVIDPGPSHKPQPIITPVLPKIDLPDMDMVYVEGGTFMMGATAEQGKDADSDEKPAHRVSLDSYYIGKYPVTQRLWKAVMGSNPSYFKGEKLPVECVSWNKVQKFLKKLNAMTGKNFRLPTEAEWEFAARGGNRSRGYKYSGSNNIDDVAWYEENSLIKKHKWFSYLLDGKQTHPVGTKRPNELGIYDMSGNVYEWCQDWYDSKYYENSPQHNPQGAISGSYRVFRGGSWYNGVWGCRVSLRSFNSPAIRDSRIGFRLAL